MNYLMAQAKYYRNERVFFTFPWKAMNYLVIGATSLVKAITQQPQPQYQIMSSAPNMAQTCVMNGQQSSGLLWPEQPAGETVLANNY